MLSTRAQLELDRFSVLPPTNYKRNPKQMMMFTFIPLLIDGGTYSQA